MIDGLACTGIPSANPDYLAAALGIDAATWWDQPTNGVFGFGLAGAVNAVWSGQCETALATHTVHRRVGSTAPGADPLRSYAWSRPSGRRAAGDPTALFGTVTYAGRMQAYMAEYGATYEDFAALAINGRSNAARNPLAIFQKAISLDDYLASPFVDEPMRVLDMDASVDGSDAFLVTSVERARDLVKRPVLIHSASFGMTDRPSDDHMPDLRHTGQHVALEALWRRSELQLADIDVLFPYDGFTIIAMNWIENAGYCAKGEGPGFISDNWDTKSNSIRINGHVPVNPHGGSLSEGATTSSGHFREAVYQLRGEAGERQVPDALAALVTPGGFFLNSQAFILRADQA